jgi:hypothetical protein
LGGGLGGGAGAGLGVGGSLERGGPAERLAHIGEREPIPAAADTPPKTALIRPLFPTPPGKRTLLDRIAG